MYSEHMIEMMEDEIVHKFIEDNNEDDDDFVEEEQEQEEMLQESDLSESTLANNEKKFNLSDNIKFSKISGDKNKNHIENNYANSLEYLNKIESNDLVYQKALQYKISSYYFLKNYSKSYNFD